MKNKLLLLGALSFLAVHSAQAVVVNWVDETTYGLGDLSGTPLAVGYQVKLGSFNLSDALIQANAANLSFLNSHFTLFDTTTIGGSGDTAGIAGYFAASSPNLSTISLGLSGKQIYIWAFNAVSGATATEHGIFTATAANWIFPDDNAIPNTTSIELNQATDIIVGGFGVGTSSATGSAQPLFNTAVPEPASYALLGGLAALGFMVLRRCRRS